MKNVSNAARADLTEGPIALPLISFTFPIFLGNLFQQFYNMADTIIVGRLLGEEALAAVGASYALTTVFISIAFGGAIGASVITGQHLGAKNYERMKTSIYTTLSSFIIFSMVMALAGLFLSKDILSALNTPEDIMDMATDYLGAYFLGLPFLFSYNALSSIFNSMGRSRIPLFFLIFSSILNICLDIMFVGPLGMGVRGAAVATVLSQGISAILSFCVLKRKLKEYRTPERPRLFECAILRKILRVALPSIISQSIISIGMMLVQSVVNGFGSMALAGYSAAIRVDSFVVSPFTSLGTAVSAFVSQNMGSGNPDRAKAGFKVALVIMAAVALIIMIVLCVFPEKIILLFLGSDYSAFALEVGSGYIAFTGFFYFILGAKICTDGLLRGAGDMKLLTIANLLNLGIRVALAYLATPLVGINAIWYAIPLGWFVNLMIEWLRYKSGRWRKVKAI